MSHDYGEARILLVEDSPINQEVILSLLEQWQLRADVAVDGWTAIAALQQHEYDLVFMDVQMPGLDGLAATVKVRDPQTGARNARVPIVAMTADLREEDRQRCLAAGMNDCLAKPFALAELKLILDRYLARTAAPLATQTVGASPPVAPASPVFDATALLQRLLGNRAAATRVIRTFLGDVPGRLARIRHALDVADLESVMAELHTLKGAAASLAGEATRVRVSAMEASAKDGDLAGLRVALPRLEDEIERLCKALEVYLS